MRYFMVALILCACTGTAFAQDKIDRMSADIMQSFTPDTAVWNDEPILPKGVKKCTAGR